MDIKDLTKQLTPDKAVENLKWLCNHKDLKILNRQEMMNMEVSILVLNETARENELLKNKITELETIIASKK